MKTLNTEDIKKIFKNIKVIMQENEDRLFKLDSLMGDGDLGLTMKNGFDKAYESISGFEEEDIGKIFMKAGMTMASAVPSTMGTLMATGLMMCETSIGFCHDRGVAPWIRQHLD